MKKLFKNLITFLSFTFLGCSLFANQYVLFGTVGNGDTGTSTLVILNQNTGSLEQTIGNIGYIVNGLAYDSTTGTLYATTSIKDLTAPVSLITIDTETGAGSVVAPLAPTSGGTVTVTTIDSTGQLYGWLEPGTDDLVRIDKNTGTVFLYPNSGLGTGGHSLDFNASDILYILDSGTIYTISTLTGIPANVGTYTPSPNDHHGKFNPVTQQFWTISTGGGNNPRSLNIFDIPSGVLINTLPTINYLHTISFAQITPIEATTNLLRALGKKRLIYQRGLYP
ncbi:MAG: hypothetical protein H7A41_01180 [Chlamydiales bacterium]|nr:hypothetical protein [Chlamydiales bacterium]